VNTAAAFSTIRRTAISGILLSVFDIDRMHPLQPRSEKYQREGNESDEIAACLTRRRLSNKMQALYCPPRFCIFDDFHTCCSHLFCPIPSIRKCEFYMRLDVK